jgi:hypothetical protein
LSAIEERWSVIEELYSEIEERWLTDPWAMKAIYDGW